jgi:hypothetical protein
MDGGGIALVNGEIVTAWRREHNVFLARPGKPEVDLGPGQDIALADGRKGPVAVWVRGKAVELLEPGAAAREISANGAFPTIVKLADGALLAAWEEDGAIATRRIE